MSDMETLHSAIADMDLPSQKRTAVETGDLRWLMRNMGIRNSDHARFDEAMTALKNLLRTRGA